MQNISECDCCYELVGCVEALVSDIVLQDLPEGMKLNRASWIRSHVPPEVNPLFSFFFFSAGLLLHEKVSDEVQYLPSDLECCFTRKQHRHQAFSLRKLLITALTRGILEWRHESYSTQTKFDSFSLGNVSNGGVFCLL